VLATLVTTGLTACGGSSSDSSGGDPSGPSAASCAGDASKVAVYVAYSQNGSGYAEGLDSSMANCELLIQTGVSGGMALSSASDSLHAVGAADGGFEVRVFNHLSTRGNSSLNLAMDYVVPITTVPQPEGLLNVNLGGGAALSVIANGQQPDAGQAPKTVLAMSASWVEAGSSSGQYKDTQIMQDATGGPVWNMAYDSTADRLFAATLGGSVVVFDKFEQQVESGKTPKPSRTITPGAIDNTGHSSSIAGALHAVVYASATDQLVIADYDKGALYVVDNASTADDAAGPSGGSKTVVPGRIVSGSTTMLTHPTDLQVDSNGYLYVADQGGTGAVLCFEKFMADTSSAPTPEAMSGGIGGMPTFLAVAAGSN
jgi:hypothetical protein